MPRPPSPHLAKPDRMFARSWEWSELTAFAADPEPGATLGVVSGRRRQGKTFLLDSLAQAAGGFYFQAVESTEAESLHQLGAALGQYTGARIAVDHEHANFLHHADGDGVVNQKHANKQSN